MSDTDNGKKKAGVYKDTEGHLTQNVFTKRSDMESAAILRNMGLVVITEAGEELRIPRWSIELTDRLGRVLSTIIHKLYPHNELFLQVASGMEDKAAVDYVYNVVFLECINEIKQLVLITMRIEDDIELSRSFTESVTITDVLNIVRAIVEQEIQNPMLVALVKKTVDELTTKLRLVTS